jgi:hypothetical protein
MQAFIALTLLMCAVLILARRFTRTATRMLSNTTTTRGCGGGGGCCDRLGLRGSQENQQYGRL